MTESTLMRWLGALELDRLVVRVIGWTRRHVPAQPAGGRVLAPIACLASARRASSPDPRTAPRTGRSTAAGLTACRLCATIGA
jgi:hypothetical protein